MAFPTFARKSAVYRKHLDFRRPLPTYICTMRVPRRLVAAVVLLAVPLAGVTPAGAAGMVGAPAGFPAPPNAHPVRAPGHIGIASEDVKTGATSEFNSGTEMPAASTIKIPVMVEVFHQLIAEKF